MENGSLQEALFDEMYGTSLDWDLRFKIILDTARGLASLHYDCDPPIIHGDVKPSNILLDKHFAARIADFGLARLKSEETETIARSEAIQREHIERERIRYERNERKRTRRAKRRHADAGRRRSMDNSPSSHDIKSPLEKSPLSPATSANDFITPDDMVRRDGYATSHGSETMTGTEEASPYRLEFDPSRVRSPLSVLPSPTTRQSSPSILQESREVDPPSSLAASIVEIVPSDAEKSIRESAISPSEGYRDDVSLESGRSERKLRRGSRTSESRKLWNRDWWWPQDTNSGELTLQDFINWAPTRSIASSKGERKTPGSKESAGGTEGSESITPISQSLRADKQNLSNCSRSSFASDHGWGEPGDESTGRKKKDKQRNDKYKIWERRREEKNEELGKSKGRHAESKSRDSFRSSGGKTKTREWWREDKSEATLPKSSPVLGRLTARKKEDKRGKGEHTKRDWWKEENSEKVGTSKTKHAKSNSFDKDGFSSKVGNSKTRESWREESNNGEMGQTKLPESSPLAASKPPESVSGQSLRKKASGRKKKSRIRDCFSGDVMGIAAATSTPSIRGTTCYLAPESGGGGILNEKGDVYSFGVLLLVIVAGRRPIQVMASPMASPISEFEKANLVSWARHLARSGNVLDLVDGVLEGQYSKEQVVLCTTLALLCLQRLPSLRPTMGDVVKILLGESNLPSLPVNFSPSPSNFPSRRRKSSAGRVPAPSVVSLP